MGERKNFFRLIFSFPQYRYFHDDSIFRISSFCLKSPKISLPDFQIKTNQQLKKKFALLKMSKSVTSLSISRYIALNFSSKKHLDF